MYTCHVVDVEEDLFNAEPTVTETLSNNQELPTQACKQNSPFIKPRYHRFQTAEANIR